MSRLRRVEAAVRALNPPPAPPDPPGVVFVVPALPDRPAGQWVRADGFTAILVYDAAGPAPDKRFPGNPLILGGEIDPFARDLVGSCGLRFEPEGG